MTLPAFRLWAASESYNAPSIQRFRSRFNFTHAILYVAVCCEFIPSPTELIDALHSFPSYLRAICTKSFCSPATESAGPLLSTLRPLSPSTTNDIGVAPVGRVKRGKKENKKRNPSLDWTVLSISPSLPSLQCSHSLSIHPSLSWPLNEALMRDIAALVAQETECSYYTSGEEGGGEATTTASTI